MKTVKQIADDLGVSKQAVFKKIDNLGLRKRLSKNGNQWLIDECIENTIKSAFLTTSRTTTSSSTGSQLVDGLVDMLQNELEAKNEQINQLQKLLDQEQQLRMVTEQKLMLLGEKQDDQKADQNQQSEEEAKENFWSRLWHRN